MNEIYHYLNDLDRILPRINEDLCGSKHKRGDPVLKLVASYTFVVVMHRSIPASSPPRATTGHAQMSVPGVGH